MLKKLKNAIPINHRTKVITVMWIMAGVFWGLIVITGILNLYKQNKPPYDEIPRYFESFTTTQTYLAFASLHPNAPFFKGRQSLDKADFDKYDSLCTPYYPKLNPKYVLFTKDGVPVSTTLKPEIDPKLTAVHALVTVDLADKEPNDKGLYEPDPLRDSIVLQAMLFTGCQVAYGSLEAHYNEFVKQNGGNPDLTGSKKDEVIEHGFKQHTYLKTVIASIEKEIDGL